MKTLRYLMIIPLSALLLLGGCASTQSGGYTTSSSGYYGGGGSVSAGYVYYDFYPSMVWYPYYDMYWNSYWDPYWVHYYGPTWCGPYPAWDHAHWRNRHDGHRDHDDNQRPHQKPRPTRVPPEDRVGDPLPLPTPPTRDQLADGRQIPTGGGSAAVVLKPVARTQEPRRQAVQGSGTGSLAPGKPRIQQDGQRNKPVVANRPPEYRRQPSVTPPPRTGVNPNPKPAGNVANNRPAKPPPPAPPPAPTSSSSSSRSYSNNSSSSSSSSSSSNYSAPSSSRSHSSGSTPSNSQPYSRSGRDTNRTER